MPVIRAGIIFFSAEADCTFVLAENQRLFATVMKFQGLPAGQVNSVMRLIEFFDNPGGWIDFTYSFYKVPSS